MPWEMIVTGAGLLLLLGAGLLNMRRRQSTSISGPIPDVGQPPKDAKPMVEPRMQDIGFATYELPLSDPEIETKTDTDTD